MKSPNDWGMFTTKGNNGKYYNKRAEMWFLMAEWVKRGGCLPRDPELKKELCAPQYSFNNGKLILESKDQIKKRLGMSPDKADALALTFALQVGRNHGIDSATLDNVWDSKEAR